MLLFSRPIGPLAYAKAVPGAAYGGPTVRRIASPTATDTAVPTDYLILVDVSGYDTAGPTINLSVPLDDFLVTIRSDVGQLSAHAVTLVAPTGVKLEAPKSPGTFANSVTLDQDFASITYAYDRVKARLVMYTDLGAATGLVWAADLFGSTNDNQWVGAISGTSGSGGLVPFNANNLVWAQNVAGSISQANKASDIGTNDFVISAQGAFSGAIANTRGGTLRLQGGPNQSGPTGLDLGGVKIGLNGSNSLTGIELSGGPAGVGAKTRLVAINYYNSGITLAQIPPTNADGTLMLADAADFAAGNFTGGVAIQSVGGGIYALQESTAGQCQQAYQLSPVQTGDVANTSSGFRSIVRRQFRITASGGTQTIPFALATGHELEIRVTAMGRVAVANTGFVVGDAFGLYRINYVSNISGTPVQVGALPGIVATAATASMAGCTVTFTFSPGFANVVITGPVSGTPPSTDWTIMLEYIVN